MAVKHPKGCGETTGDTLNLAGPSFIAGHSRSRARPSHFCVKFLDQKTRHIGTNMIIDSVDKLSQALEFINGNEILAYDTETSGLNSRKDHVIGFGVSNGIDGFYVPVRYFNTTLDTLVYCDFAHDLVGPILKALKTRKLLMFNASFDYRFTKHSLGVDLLDSLHADVLLLKHTCDEEFPFGLKEIATKLWGHDVKKEKEEMQASIKANGGTATQYFKADTEILGRYCIQDCLLTFRIFNKYSNDLRRQGLEQFYYRDEVLPLYKEVTIPLEEVGVAVDVPLLQKTLKEIDEDLLKLESTLQEAISPLLEIFTKWFLNKDYPTKTYTGKTPAWTRKYSTQIEAWRADNPTGYMFNLLSKHHLKKLFFDTLNEEPLSRTPTGQPQVDDEFLQHVSSKYDWVKLLIDFNKLTKLRGTYILKLLEEQENGIFYPSFQQHRTVSGRYSSDLQQLPRPIESSSASALVVHYTNIIREFIIPRTTEHKLVGADYEQLEPSIFAHTSGDSALQSIFNDGTDFYSEVAIRTERLTGVSSRKSDDNYLGRMDKSARQKAKAYSLGIAYGMTGYKLQFEIGVSQEEADKLVEDYLNAFPKLKQWMADSKAQAKAEGTIKTQLGRARRLPNVRRLWHQYGVCIENDLELWKAFQKNPKAYEQAKKDRKTFKNEMNNAINFQVQGLAASIVNRAALAINRELKEKNMNTKLIMQVHDELVYDVPLNELDIACSMIKCTMENIVPLTVPLRTVPQSGNKYSETK